MEYETTTDPAQRHRGRGAASNRTGRFERMTRVYCAPDEQDETVTLRTSVTVERPRSVITYNRSPDLPFDRSLNPYRGCEHGCIYCFARPSHAFLGLSPGIDFETRLIARPDAPEVLLRELRRPGYRCAPLAIGTNTDPYQPIERDYQVMRRCLEVLSACHHPVAIVTKGALIERDVELLADMARRNLVRVGISVTTLDPEVSRRMEPRVPGPQRRLRVIECLAAAGVPVRVMVSPVVPGINDHEIEAILRAARDAGAKAASWIMLRLPREVSDLFQEWLATHYPDRAAKVMGLVRDMHRGQDYLPDWGHRMRGEGRYAEMIAQRFDLAAKRLGLDVRLPPLSTERFARPVMVGDQMSLF